MAVNRGKQFEQQFVKDWRDCFPQSFIYRLPDQVSGYRGSKNVSDFICFEDGHLYLLDTKSTQGASIPIGNLSQLDMMEAYKDVPECLCGFIVWFYDKNTVVFVSSKYAHQCRKHGKKSIRFDDEELIVLPSTLKRTLMKTDYNKLKEFWL